MWKYYVSSCLVTIIVGYFLVEITWVLEAGISKGYVFYFIPGGLLAGFIGAEFENNYDISPLQKLGLVFFTIFMSVLLTLLIFVLLIFI